MAKLKKKNEIAPTDELALYGIEYVNKKEAIKELEAQCKNYRIPLEDFVDANGKTLDNGSKLSVLPYADVDVYLRKTLRVTTKLSQDAADILIDNGFSECVDNISVLMVREEEVERLYKEGKISSELLERIYPSKKSYAFSVDVKSRMSDAPE